MSAHKHDEGKPRLGLVPPGIIDALRARISKAKGEHHGAA